MKWTGVQSRYWPVRSGCGQGVGSSAPTLQAILLLVDCSRPFVHLFGTSVVVVPFFFRFDFEWGLCKKNHIRIALFFVFSHKCQTQQERRTHKHTQTLAHYEMSSAKVSQVFAGQKPFQNPAKSSRDTPGSMSLKITKSNASSDSVCPNTLPSTWLLLAFRRPFRNSPC